jgi:hypothetical protein
MLRKTFGTGALIAAVALGSHASWATNPPETNDGDFAGTRLFVGLWEGIDPIDGSIARLSITCDQDDVCEILVAETAFTVCGGSSEGLLRGTGSIESGVLQVPDFTVTCFATGTVISDNAQYTPDFQNGTLAQRGEDPRTEPVVYHKVSLPTW